MKRLNQTMDDLDFLIHKRSQGFLGQSMGSSQLENITEIGRLEQMGPIEKLSYWGQEKPWEGLRLPNKTIIISKISTIAGNVTSMPRLSGKPCFGVPTAWLRFGHEDSKFIRKRWILSRCNKCLARQGCEKVSETRLGINDEVRKAVAEFKAAGGVAVLNDKVDGERVARRFRNVVRALAKAGPFTNSNDVYAQAWAEQETARLEGRETTRKQEQREKAARQKLKDGEIPEVLMEQLGRERIYRAGRYEQYRLSGSAPRTIVLYPENRHFTVDVWFRRTVLATQKLPSTAYAIAKQMIADQPAGGLILEILRGRVHQALKRIDVLETKLMPGSQLRVWDPFNAKTALAELHGHPPTESAED